VSSTLRRVDADELRQRLQETGQRRSEAIRVRDEAAAVFAELVPKAQAAGIPLAEIARLTGLSRQGVYDLLARASRP
jgi:DNA-binding phage protein